MALSLNEVSPRFHTKIMGLGGRRHSKNASCMASASCSFPPAPKENHQRFGDFAPEAVVVRHSLRVSRVRHQRFGATSLARV